MALPFLATTLRPSLRSPDVTCIACRRNAATFRRTRKALRVKPDASFLPSKTEPTDHIIFNPPSSAPSVYHTPSKFLPKSDPRRRLHSLAPTTTSEPESALSAASAAQSSLSSARARPIRPTYEKKYHLGKEEVEEIRRLRAEDPKEWTRVRLAEKFECSQFFVSLCCSAPVVAKQQEEQLEAIKQRWGRRKAEAREGRQVRREMWGRDG